MASQRMPYIDVLKLFAAWLIVVLHVGALYVSSETPFSEVEQFGPYVLNNFGRVALPIFMMMTGALLLREDYKFNFKRKSIHILKVYAIWSAVFLVLDVAQYHLQTGDWYGPLNLLVRWIQGPYHFWYLVLLLGFYVLMPILVHIRKLQTLTYATFLLFIICYIYSPFANYWPTTVNQLMNSFQLLYPTRSLFFFLAGGALARVPRSKNLFIFSILAFLVGLVGRFMLLRNAVDFADAMAEHLPTAWCELLIVMGLVYIMQFVLKNFGDKPLITKMSKECLYIYVMSPLVIFVYELLIQPYWDQLMPQHTVSIVIWSTIIFFATYALRVVLVAVQGMMPFRRKDKSS